MKGWTNDIPVAVFESVALEDNEFHNIKKGDVIYDTFAKILKGDRIEGDASYVCFNSGEIVRIDKSTINQLSWEDADKIKLNKKWRDR